MRPDRLVVITATGTEIGKTWTAARLALGARARGWNVAARKPAQSFDPADLGPTDAQVLGEATGADPDAVCPTHRWYPRAYAPPMAADSLGRPPITLAELVNELHWPEPTSLGLVEGAGGVHSPIAHDGDTVDLIDRIEPDLVVVVADAELGTINNVRLALGALARWPAVVHVNRYDPGIELHRRNREWLARVLAEPVTVTIDELLAVVVP